MLINRVLRRADNVTLCGTSGYALDVSYAAWADFLKLRGRLTLPFDLDYKFRREGETNVVITNAKELV
jgi:hypothetical protein